MNRWLLCLGLVFVGCVASIPADDGLTADIACEAARLVVQLRQEAPPSPAPVLDTCDNCNGTGKLGDGRIVTICPVCKGTGKKAQAAAICPTGRCPTL